MAVEVGVTEIQRSFSDYINRVSYREESFLLIRGGRPVAHLTPVPSGPGLGDLPELLRSLPPLGREEAEHFTRELGWGRGRDHAGPSAEAEEAEVDGNGGPDPASPTADPARPLLLDAVVLLDQQAGVADIEARVASREEARFHLSVITVGELYRVADRIQNPVRRGIRLRWVDALAEQLPLLNGDLATARSHAELWSRLSDQGVRLGPHDLWLTATCVAHGLTLATSDPLRFQRLSGLRIEDWGMPMREATPREASEPDG